MTETLRWRPQRTRVYDPRILENPWQRDHWRAKEDRDFFASLSGIADRQEEDEDFEVLAPRRPTRRFHQADESVLRVTEWFDPQLADLIARESNEPQYALDYYATPAGRRAEAVSRATTGNKTAREAQPFTVALEDNFEMLDELDRWIDRTEPCWSLRTGSRRWRVAKPGVRSALCSDGRRRPVKVSRLVWVIEYGHIDSQLRLEAYHAPACINPDHFRKRFRKGAT